VTVGSIISNRAVEHPRIFIEIDSRGNQLYIGDVPKFDLRTDALWKSFIVRRERRIDQWLSVESFPHDTQNST